MRELQRYQVAIPTYKRAKTLVQKTLPLITDRERRGVDPASITLFVASEEEASEYGKTVPPELYGEIVVAEPGMGAVRRFITSHYPEGTWVLQVDDDLEDLIHYLSPTESIPVPNIRAVIETGFHDMTAGGCTLWGIYPVANPYFMTPKITYDLKYIVGCFFGIEVKHDPKLQVSLEDKEDFERTLLHYLADGAVCRLNYVAPKTRYYTEPGGMQETRTKERVDQSAESLHARFPELCSLAKSKTRGVLELRLKDRRKKI